MSQGNLRAAVLLTLVLSNLLAGGCSGPPPLSGDPIASDARSKRLAGLAVEEAKLIPDVGTRLTRELNLANLQIERGWQADARVTLAAASSTLSCADGARLDEHKRLSGWVSLSELSRRSDDADAAAAATGAALAELKRIPDPARRCDYVMGLANELQYIKGKPAASALLSDAGPWTRSIDNVAARQQAVVAFSTALFNLDDFAAGRSMLEFEKDPAWRSTILSNMAEATSPTFYASADARSLQSKIADGQAIRAPATQPFYGKALTYDEVFKNQESSPSGK